MAGGNLTRRRPTAVLGAVLVGAALWTIASSCTDDPARERSGDPSREVVPDGPFIDQRPAPGPDLDGDDGATNLPVDPLSRRFGRVRARLRSRGLNDVQQQRRVFLLEGEGHALPVQLESDRCTTFAALGGGGVRDLRLSLYDRDGTEITVDAVEAEGGLLHACPQEPRARHYLVLQVLEGAGPVLVGAFESAPGTAASFAGVFAGVLAPQVPFRDVEQQLSRSRQSFRTRGWRLFQEPTFESVAEGETLRHAAVLEPGRCYVAMARGGEGIADIDLFLFDPAGAEIARHMEGDAEPSIEHCPEEGGRYTLEVRAFEGAGAIGVMLLEGLGEDRAAPIRTLEPHVVSPPGQSVEDPVGLVGSAAAALVARGYGAPVVMVSDGQISPGEVRTHETELQAGCVAILGGGARDMDLDLYLQSASGAPLDSDTGVRQTARVNACTEQPTRVHVVVKAYGVAGAYALSLVPAPRALADVGDLRLEEATARYLARGYRRVNTSQATLGRSESFTTPIDLLADTCIAVAVAGDREIGDVDLFLRDETGELVASESGPEPYAAVGRCATRRERLALEVVAYRGGGTITVARLEGTP